MTVSFDNANCDGAVHNHSKGPVFPIVEYRQGDDKYRSLAPFDGCNVDLVADDYAGQRDNSHYLKRVECAADKAYAAYVASGRSGFTIGINGPSPESGFMVSIAACESISPVKSPFGDYEGRTYGKLYNYIHENWDRLNGNGYFGGWVFNGQLFLDVSLHFADRSEALDFAVANGQLAIFDLDKFVSIPV